MSKAEDLKQLRADALLALSDVSFIRFKGGSLVSTKGTHGFTPIKNDWFSSLCYEQFGMGMSKSAISELLHVIETMAPDLSASDRYIGFGEQVWDTKTLSFLENPLSVRPVYSSRIPLNTDSKQIAKVQEYFLALADGDKELAKDYPQMVAAMFMYRKPVGIIWALGAGANGKSIFLESLDAPLGKHFSHLTMSMIEDGRATPALRGVLANINTETSEKRVDDMGPYKNIGAHEPFDVRLLGTHDVVTVDTNFHTIFCANNIPAFGDKTMGSRRRTILVPFPAKFEEDLGFVERTFTKEFVGAMLHIILESAMLVGEHGYNWSPASRALQDQYNKDSNTAEAFGRYLDELGVVGFRNYTRLRFQYELWCSNQASVALGNTQLRRGIETILKVKPIMFKENGVTARAYLVPDLSVDDVNFWENGNATPKETEQKILEQLTLEQKTKSEW